MIQDENLHPLQAVGATALARASVTANVGVPNRVDLDRNKVYRMLALHDIYFMQGGVNDAADFDPPNVCEYLPGGQFLIFTTEDYEYLYVESVAAANVLVFICEVG